MQNLMIQNKLFNGTREEYLQKAKDELNERVFKQAGYEIPEVKISCSWEILIKAISSTYLSNLIFSHVINSKDRFRNWISFEKFSSYFVDADLSKIKIDAFLLFSA